MQVVLVNLRKIFLRLTSFCHVSVVAFRTKNSMGCEYELKFPKYSHLSSCIIIGTILSIHSCISRAFLKTHLHIRTNYKSVR